MMDTITNIIIEVTPAIVALVTLIATCIITIKQVKNTCDSSIEVQKNNRREDRRETIELKKALKESNRLNRELIERIDKLEADKLRGLPNGK